MTKRWLYMLWLLLTVTCQAGWAQATDSKKSVLRPDSVNNDYEEWLRNEPPKPKLRDSSILQPLLPRLPDLNPHKEKADTPSISINVITPALRNDMRLAYHSHWLEEQRKAQQGGAMTIGLNPIALIGWAVRKIFPKHKSKKQRQREQLQQILDNY
jgi:hypothetical protein